MVAPTCPLSQTASRSVQPFMQGSSVRPTDWQTHRQITLRVTYVAIDRSLQCRRRGFVIGSGLRRCTQERWIHLKRFDSKTNCILLKQNQNRAYVSFVESCVNEERAHRQNQTEILSLGGSTWLYKRILQQTYQPVCDIIFKRCLLNINWKLTEWKVVL